MKQSKMGLILAVIGAALLVVGLFVMKAAVDPQGVLLVLPYVCIGVGCGALGQGLGSLISNRAVKNSPELQKQLKIEKHDERNVAIANRAKAKAYDRMTFMYAALMLSFALMGVEMPAVLLLVFAYLFVQGSGIYYRFKYEKEM